MSDRPVGVPPMVAFCPPTETVAPETNPMPVIVTLAPTGAPGFGVVGIKEVIVGVAGAVSVNGELTDCPPTEITTGTEAG